MATPINLAELQVDELLLKRLGQLGDLLNQNLMDTDATSSEVHASEALTDFESYIKIMRDIGGLKEAQIR